MRIAYLCADFGIPLFGNKGAAVHIRALSQALADCGQEAIVFTPRARGRRPDGFEVPYVELPLDPFDAVLHELLSADPRGGRSVAREMRAATYGASLRHRLREPLRDFAPDVIYERYSLFASAGAVLASELEVPRIVEVNAPLTEEQAVHRGLAFAEAARATEREILKSAEHVVAVSRELERWLVRLGVPSRRITVLPNAVDPSRLEVSERTRARFRAMLGLDGEPVVGFVGTLKPWHDTAGLVRAIAVLHRRGLEARLLVVGDGPDRSAIEALAEAEGIAPATAFTGAVPYEDVPAYIAAADVLAAPYAAQSRFYFSPLKLFEYLAAARPVVAAQVGDIPHCFQPATSGLLYQPGNVASLADALQRLLRNPEEAARLGQAGRRHVLTHHTWDGTAKSVIGLAKRLVRAPVTA